MARSMSSDMLAGIQAQNVYPVLFVTATFATGPVYLWTGTGAISWNGHTWVGVGALGGISAIEEGGDIQARGVTLSLSGFDAGLLADVLTEFQSGAPVAVYFGLFNTSGALIADPIVAWSGRMGQATTDVDGTTASISIDCENRLVDMNVSIARRYTNDDQQLRAPGDQAFSFVPGIQEALVYFGTKPNNSVNV